MLYISIYIFWWWKRWVYHWNMVWQEKYWGISISVFVEIFPIIPSTCFLCYFCYLILWMIINLLITNWNYFPGDKKGREPGITGLERQVNLSYTTRIDNLQEERNAAISLANKMVESVKFQATQVSKKMLNVKCDNYIVVPLSNNICFIFRHVFMMGRSPFNSLSSSKLL